MNIEILKTIENFKDLKLVSGPNFRQDRDMKNESGEIVKKGTIYYDCDLEFKGKKFPITFREKDNIKDEIIEVLKQWGIPI